ncbi:tRNA 4-thiouridine(8) synthase ThiI [Verrucomicrobiota bacterium]
MTLKLSERISALCLLSGGLDSQLSVCLLKDQGIEVHGVVFDSPFSDIEAAVSAAEQMDITLHVVNFSADIMSLLDKPRHGFGSCMNPCIDCHALMLKRAGEMIEEMGIHFLCTGEVLNERPMSQNRNSLKVVAEESGYEDLILRPLSACLLSETKPERKGWVDRSKLLSIEGRSRKTQLQLAKHYGLTNFPSPAGGCRLTEPNFCRRLKDLKEHEGLDGVRSVYLLRFGRHFRLGMQLKMIVGRNEHDNATLEGNAELYDLIFKVEDFPGPTGLLPFTASEEEILLAGAICARYSDCSSGQPVTLKIRSSRGARHINVMPVSDETADDLRI